jgi:hypothetical protein
MMDSEGDFIGQLCNIEAAEESGERFNPCMTNDERRAVGNLMLMCYAHHVKTNDVKTYTVDVLRKFKSDHERRFSEPQRAILEKAENEFGTAGGIFVLKCPACALRQEFRSAIRHSQYEVDTGMLGTPEHRVSRRIPKLTASEKPSNDIPSMLAYNVSLLNQALGRCPRWEIFTSV